MKKITSFIFYLIIFLHLIPSAELLSDNKVISVLGMGNLNCIAYSPDGNHFASAGDLGKIYIWDLKTSYVIDTIQTNGIKSIAYSPDGTKIAVGSVGGETFIYDVTSGDELHVFFDTDHWPDITSILFSPDGKFLICGNDDETVKIWDISKEKLIRTFEGYSNNSKSISLSLDGTKLAVVSNDFLLSIYDINTGDTIDVINAKNNIVHTVAFSPDGTKLIYTDLSLIIYDLLSKQPIDTLIGDSTYEMFAVFNPDGSQIVSFGNDSVLRFWDWKNQVIANKIKMSEAIRQIKLNKDGTKILCSYDLNIKYFDVITGLEEKVFIGHTRWFSNLLISKDGLKLACRGDNMDVVVWDLTKEKIIRIIPGYLTRLNPITFNLCSSGDMIAIGRGDSIFIFDVDSGLLLKTLTGHTGRVISVAFSDDETLLASSSVDSTIKIWDLKKGSIIKNVIYSNNGYDFINKLKFSPDTKNIFCRTHYEYMLFNLAKSLLDTILVYYDIGYETVSADFKTLALGEDWDIKLYDMQTKSLLYDLNGNLDIHSLAFSPDGKFLVSAGSFGGYIGNMQIIQLWDVINGKLLTGGFYGHTGSIGSMIFSPDGTKLASSGGEGTIKIWRFDIPSSVEEVPSNEDVILISPNPASDYIEISIPTSKEGVGGVVPVRIFDILGMEVLKVIDSRLHGNDSHFPESNFRIDISLLSPGVYFARIGDVVRKFVKI